MIASAAAGEALIGGTLAAVIAGAVPGVPPRGNVRTSCDGGSGTLLREVGPHAVHRLDEVDVQRHQRRVVAGQQRIVDECVEVLRVGHLDVRQLAGGAFDDLVLAEVGARAFMLTGTSVSARPATMIAGLPWRLAERSVSVDACLRP